MRKTKRTRFPKDRLQTIIRENITIKGDCWIWSRSKNSRGYGQAWDGITNVQAHRLSYEVFNGSAGKLLVLHKCDNPACVNPDHLFLGTGSDNMNDAYKKGRKGKVKPSQQVVLLTMMQAGLRNRDLFHIFGVTRCAISLWRRKFKEKGLL